MSESPAPEAPSVSTRRALIVLGLGTTALFAAPLPSWGLVHPAWVRLGGGSLIHLRYDGWLVTAVQWGLGCLLVMAFLGGVLSVRRSWRGLTGHTPYRRVPVLIALVPGIGLGVLGAGAVSPTLTWASEHTADGRAAEARFQQQLRDLKTSPTYNSLRPAASSELAAVMLRATDLGSGWYLVQRPSPFAVDPGQLQDLGATDGGIAMLVKSHRTGETWSDDGLISMSAYTFGTPAASESYRLRQDRASDTLGRWLRSTRRIAGTVVHLRVSAEPPGSAGSAAGSQQPARRAAFVVGSTTFTLLSRNTTAAEFGAIVDAAVRRAAAPRS